MTVRSRYRITDVEPEFYLHVEVAPSLRKEDLTVIRRRLKKIAHAALSAKFPEVDIEFEIDLEKGSLKAWIRKYGAITLILTAVVKYADIREGIDYLCSDISWVLTEVKEKCEQAFRGYDVREWIRTERRVGAVARLDGLIQRYQNGELSEESFMEEANTILKRIHESDQRDQLLPVLRVYMDKRGVDWEQLASNVPPPLPRQDNLDEPRRRPRETALPSKRRKRLLETGRKTRRGHRPATGLGRPGS